MAVQRRVSQKEKWQYVLKTAMLWAFGISTFIYLFQWVTGQVTEESSSISLALMSILLGIIVGAIVLLPIGIMAGLLFWRRR
ncbi:hypothetical protein [Mesobacillus selenatarsenatis]|uniref:hypothetical protein n=1 Tax=Mesobacillus selenatarsenatis TaxID=388741 RepID=UPI0005AA83A4|nr:hypothetical protein [Mesobacillus selenatarsenatis]